MLVDSFSVITQNLGEVTKTLRLSRRLTQAEFAAELSRRLGRGIDQSMISKMESNIREIGATELLAMLDTLGYDSKCLMEVASQLELGKAKMRASVVEEIIDDPCLS
ncbi:MAG: helix-turn-helix transcriptional regulator [Candidatus Andersenbacteria bacterium]